jgi:tRNA-dihydrouridine synthase B
MFKIGKINIDKAILLAPMEDVTDVSFRLICKELGADVVYTEFVNAEGLIRASEKTHKKLKIIEEERPVGIQIYGGNLNSMINAAKIAEEENPDLIDINAGCWVKNVVNCGAGAGLLKDPVYLQSLVKAVVDVVSLPVTVKTRIGWDFDSIQILEVAKRLEDAGAQGLVIHCRTRSQGHKGEPDWSWIPKIKEVVKIPVALNGGIMTAEDSKLAFDQTNADAIMIARGAIANPWIFREAKEIVEHGKILTEVTNELKIKTCIRHLELSLPVKGDKRAILEHRKFYSGYLKGMKNASHTRMKLMKTININEIRDILLAFLDELETIHCEN